MKKFSKKCKSVKFLKASFEEKVISEESLLSMSMDMYAASVLQDAVTRITTARCPGCSRGELNWVAVDRPRLRGPDGEVLIPEYAKLQSKKEYNESVRRVVMGGLSTRSFERYSCAL